MTTTLKDRLVAVRRDLHRIPELSFDEKATRAYLEREVSRFARVVPVGGTGFYADLGPASASRTLLLRADMDGLPITEATGHPWASQHAGRMHACGHDGHMAALLVAAELLGQAPPDDLRLRILFQPAEEGGGGALSCIADGALEGVDGAFGIHLWNELPIGTVALTPGGIMAGVVEFTIHVRGRGGHGAMPHRTADPVVAAALLVVALQNIASRFTSPTEPVVVTVGSIHAGDAFNVIPDACVLKGTVRTFSIGEQAAVEGHMRAIASGVGAATDTQMEVTWTVYTSPTVNDETYAGHAKKALERMTGVDRVLTDYRTMAGEDFGEILRVVPGCFALVGSGNPGRGLAEPHHSPRFDFDEDALVIACDLHRAVAAELADGACW